MERRQSCYKDNKQSTRHEAHKIKQDLLLALPTLQGVGDACKQVFKTMAGRNYSSLRWEKFALG